MRISRLALTSIAFSLALAPLVGALAQSPHILPRPEPSPVIITDPSRDATPPAWPAQVKANEGAPNVVLILLDDAGFGATATFGGPAKTPELDKLAASGLRYNAFHVSALCSPSRDAGRGNRKSSGRGSHAGCMGRESDRGAHARGDAAAYCRA